MKRFVINVHLNAICQSYYCYAIFTLWDIQSNVTKTLYLPFSNFVLADNLVNDILVDLEDNDRQHRFLLQIVYTWCSKKKQPTEFLRNGFNLLWVSPADMNESILALVDLLTWLTGPKSHNKFTLSPDTKLNESKYFY